MLFPLFNVSVVHAIHQTENHKSNYRKTKNDKIYVGDAYCASRRATRSSINYCTPPTSYSNYYMFNCCRASVSARGTYSRSSHTFNSNATFSSHNKH